MEKQSGLNGLPNEMTKRTQALYDSLIDRSLGDRSGEWFTHQMFEKYMAESDSLKNLKKLKPLEMPEETVQIRRAEAIDVMLKAMTDKENSKKTCTAEIFPNDLLLGTLPMGSNGLGKVFPEYLSEAERRAGSITNRSSMSLLGHNSLNYSDLVNKGLDVLIEECEKTQKINEKRAEMYGYLADSLLSNDDMRNNQRDFYKSVIIACTAVKDFAIRFADEAAAQAKQTKDPARKAELIEMERIARKVPHEKADTFREAVQSIWFFHLALHASMNFISLGRLDQVLNPFLEKAEDKSKCLEIFECFLIKAAWRLNLNLTPSNIIKQDHVDNSTVLGTNPYLIDQKAGVNNFLQNIIIGGVKPNGDDATNECTYLILQAFSNVNLSTPGVYVRVHGKNPDLLKAIATVWQQTKNNPSIINDEVMIPAMKRALSQDVDSDDKEEMAKIEELANDYCIDGCWEPILNGKSDWTFSMLSALTPLECALNEGAMLTNDPELFRGAKKAPRTIKPTNYKELMEAFASQLDFFVDQAVIALFLYYMMDEYACPSPLLSAYLGSCVEKGRDKSWGGTDYKLGGVIMAAVPNVVNTLAGFRKWVFPEKGKPKYSLDEVCSALRNNFVCGDPLDLKTEELYTKIKIDFGTNSPTFGNNSEFADDITKEVLDIYHHAVMRSAKFAKKVYQDKPEDDERSYIVGLRSISGYYGLSLDEKFRQNFNMKVTAGLGTFEQYNWQGRGNAASADRLSGEPVAPNFSPVSGTADQGFGGLFGSLEKFELERFAGGVITDTCLETCDPEKEKKKLNGIISSFVESKGAMMTMAIGDKEIYREIYEQTLAAQKMGAAEKTREMLKEYAHVNVRIGGWQTPFITLPVSHMENYVQRPMDAKLKKGKKTA